jgi:MEMO1 family protein
MTALCSTVSWGTMIRKPAVAGRFYPADRETLKGDLIKLTKGQSPPDEPRGIALLVPHAGYMYSGRVAGATFTAVRLARRSVILCPNHTGLGEGIAVDDEGLWETPLGQVSVDSPLARAVLARSREARSDRIAHRLEHSLEVELPFLQHLLGEISFVPICVGTLDLAALLDLGRSVASAVQADGGDVLIVISSDMSHYIPAAAAATIDHKAIERIVALDPEGLHRVVRENDISMCGVAPAVAGLEAARCLGAQRGRLVAYSHSGETTGDQSSVVGYAGVAVT